MEKKGNRFGKPGGSFKQEQPTHALALPLPYRQGGLVTWGTNHELLATTQLS